MHVAPACAGFREGSDHFGTIVRSLSLHFCKRLFPGLEPVTSWSQRNNFTAAPRLPLGKKRERKRKEKNRYDVYIVGLCCGSSLPMTFDMRIHMRGIRLSGVLSSKVPCPPVRFLLWLLLRRHHQFLMQMLIR